MNALRSLQETFALLEVRGPEPEDADYDIATDVIKKISGDALTRAAQSYTPDEVEAYDRLERSGEVHHRDAQKTPGARNGKKPDGGAIRGRNDGNRQSETGEGDRPSAIAGHQGKQANDASDTE